MQCNAVEEQPEKQWAKLAALMKLAHDIELLGVSSDCAIGCSVHAVHLFNRIWGILVVA